MKRALWIICFSLLMSACNGDREDNGKVDDDQKENGTTTEEIYTVIGAEDYNLQHWGAYESDKQEAIKRIVEHRMGGVALEVKLPDGSSLPSNKVSIDLTRHDFKWGAVVKKHFSTGEHKVLYRETFLKYFNAAGFSLALKPRQVNSDHYTVALEQTMPWFEQNDIYVRGHNLTWEGYDFFTTAQRAVYDNDALSDSQKGEQLKALAKEHFYSSFATWDVDCWDVSNEPIVNDDINKFFPDMDTHAYWFKLAKELRESGDYPLKREAKLYQNENLVISAITKSTLNMTKKGYTSVGKPALYHEHIEKQIAEGAPIEGIGFQSRIKAGLITPDVVYKRLCTFDSFNLPYQATEFEIVDSNAYTYTSSERKLITEYLMVTYFSHPLVEGFWHWTFADSTAKNEENFALFNYEGEPNVTGAKWISLMTGFLDSNGSFDTDTEGKALIKAYYGDYNATVYYGGKVYTGSFSIKKESDGETVVLNLESAKK